MKRGLMLAVLRILLWSSPTRAEPRGVHRRTRHS